MAGGSQGLNVFEVEVEHAGKRLDVYLAERVAAVSRAKIQKLILAGQVRVNSEPAKAKTLLVAKDVVHVVWDQPPTATLEPVAFPLAIIYEDEQIIVINKPAGLPVHPGAGPKVVTLAQALLAHCGNLGQSKSKVKDPLQWSRPGIVHRLDKDTTGVLVAAKTDAAHAALARQFHDKTKLQREYLALLDGCMREPVVDHESYLYRDPAHRTRFASVPKARLTQEKATPPANMRYARSTFAREAVYAHRLTLARVRLFTGRTHQIRVHARDLGLPILGDPLYHHPTQLPLPFPADVRTYVLALKRQMLHASTLAFNHPESGEPLHFEAPLPGDFLSLIGMLNPMVSPL